MSGGLCTNIVVGTWGPFATFNTSRFHSRKNKWKPLTKREKGGRTPTGVSMRSIGTPVMQNIAKIRTQSTMKGRMKM
jgi:hypothetical protein